MYATLKTPSLESYSNIGTPVITTDNVQIDVSDNINPGPSFVNITGTTTETVITKTKTTNQDFYLKIAELPEYALNEAVDFNDDLTNIYVSFTVTMANGSPLLSWGAGDWNLYDEISIVEDETTNLWLSHDISSTPLNSFTRDQM